MLVIAPRNMHLDIINYYRKDNPFFDIKVIDKSDLVKASGYEARKDTVLYMMSKLHYSYDEATTYLSYLKADFVPNSSKLEKLKELQKELIEANYLFKSEVTWLLFAHKEITVIGYSNFDEELLHLSNLLDIKLEFYKFDDDYKVSAINNFSRLEDEVYYVLNEIAHDIESGTNINDIYILNRNEEYLYYLKSFSPLFGFQINYPNNYSFVKTGVYSEFKKLYEETHDLDASIEELGKICLNDDIYFQFVDVINKLRIDDLDYEIESIYLQKELANQFVEEPHYLNAVNLINEPSFLFNKKIYVIGFSQGQFPKSKKDDSYLNEDELVYLHKLTNKTSTKIDQACLLDFFKLDNNFVLSYSNKSLENSKIIASPLMRKLDLKINSNPFNNYFYSENVLKYIACSLKDLNVLYKERSPLFLSIKELVDKEFNSYDNSYSDASPYNKNSHLRLSTTQLTNYAECPFKYYLSRVLNVDPFEESIDSIFGNVVHKLLENGLLDESYDLSLHYDELVNSSNVSDDIKILWTLSLKDQILQMVKYLRKHNRYMNKPVYKFEETIDIKLDNYTVLTGKIDKMVILNEKYLIMIDYKTGSSGDFDDKYLKEGLSTQLPTYALLTKESKYSKYTISGLYINHVYTNKDIEIKDEELIPKYLKLSGKSFADYSAFFDFDNTIAGGKSSFVNSITSKEGVLQSKSSLVSKDQLDEYIKIVKDKYLEVAGLIRNNKFDISPIDKGNNGRACQNCSYRDICFVRESQVRYLSSSKENEDE